MTFYLRVFVALGVLALVVPGAAWAQSDHIYVRGEKAKKVATIREESPTSIKVEITKGKFEEIPADKIVNINYDKVEGANSAFKDDMAVNTAKPEARGKALADAVKTYENVLKKLDAKARPNARRHFEFRIGYLL